MFLTYSILRYAQFYFSYFREPHEIVRFPIDVSKMSEMERSRLLSKRYGKTIKSKFHSRISLDEDDYDEELGDFDDITQ